MKLVCPSHYLKESLILSERITGRNLTLPILNSVLISAKNNKLKITATNLEIGLEIVLPAKIKKEGKLAVSAKTLNNLVAGFSDENVSLESQNNNLALSTKNTSSIIKGQAVDDFPLLPSVQKKNSFSLPASDLVAGLKSVWHAASLSDIKPEISSILVSSQKNQPLVFASTDSFRLAEKSFFNNPPFLSVFLIPQRSAAEIIRIFDNKDSNVEFFTDKNQMVMSCDNIRFFSRLVEGRFPDYQQVVPKGSSTEVIVVKDALNSALKTAGVFSSRLNELKLKVYPEDNLLELKTANSDLGEHVNNLPVKAKGEGLEITFNHRYLLEGLQFVNSSEVLMRFNSPEKPLMVSGVGDSSYYYLVMPMKNI